jgi:hypothetical protein
VLIDITLVRIYERCSPVLDRSCDVVERIRVQERVFIEKGDVIARGKRTRSVQRGCESGAPVRPREAYAIIGAGQRGKIFAHPGCGGSVIAHAQLPVRIRLIEHGSGSGLQPFTLRIGNGQDNADRRLPRPLTGLGDMVFGGRERGFELLHPASVGGVHERRARPSEPVLQPALLRDAEQAYSAGGAEQKAVFDPFQPLLEAGNVVGGAVEAVF